MLLVNYRPRLSLWNRLESPNLIGDLATTEEWLHSELIPICQNFRELLLDELFSLAIAKVGHVGRRKHLNKGLVCWGFEVSFFFIQPCSFHRG